MKNENDAEFGEYLKQRREQRRMSQQALAERINIDRTHISMIENNRGNPSFSTIRAIAQGLSLSLSEFFSDDVLPPREPPKIEVVFGEKVPEKRYKEKVFGGYVPIPVITDHLDILNGPPDEEKVEDYFVLPRSWLRGLDPHDLAAVTTDAKPNSWAIINLDARTLEDGCSYLAVMDGKTFVGQARENGDVMTLVREHPCEGQPFFYIMGRKNPRPTILGQVIYYGEARMLDAANVK